MSASLMVTGTKLRKSWCSTLLRVDILHVRAINVFERGELRSKGGGKKSIQFNGSEETRRIVSLHCYFPPISSVSTEQQQICAWNWDPDSRNPTEGEICESLVIPTEIPNADAISQSSTLQWHKGDLVARIRTEIHRIFLMIRNCRTTMLRKDHSLEGQLWKDNLFRLQLQMNLR